MGSDFSPRLGTICLQLDNNNLRIGRWEFYRGSFPQGFTACIQNKQNVAIHCYLLYVYMLISSIQDLTIAHSLIECLQFETLVVLNLFTELYNLH